jgi:hypothetical protein
MNRIRIFLLLAFINVVVIAFVAVRLAAAADNRSSESTSEEADRIGIERLHRLDVEATLSDKADELAKLWDSEAVRIQPGRPAEIGKAEIYANDKRWEAKPDRPRTLCYKSEIKDVRIAGEWAFEGDARESAESDEAPTGRLLEIRARDCLR